jgi:sialate O-acetylesterase
MDSLTLASLFTDHLVLQRDRANRLWGWDRPGQPITLRVEGMPEPVGTTAAGDGSWSLHCPPLPTGGPCRLRIHGSSERVLEDVLVGEVWLASGQSNMEWPLLAAGDGETEIARADQYPIRMFKVARTTSREPARQVDGQWQVSSPQTAHEFSVVGYFYAQELHRRLGVPIGIIDASWGGTRVEAWTSLSALTRVMQISSAQPSAEELNRIRAEYAATVSEWQSRTLHRDPGNSGESEGFPRPEYDDSSWRPMSLPSFWQAHGMKFNGAVWFRREFQAPAQWVGHDAVLSLGAIDDFDHTYLNGELVGAHPQGTPDAFRILRRYQLPGRLLRSGKNVIAVRVFDHAGEGGFVGPASALWVETTAPGAGASRSPANGAAGWNTSCPCFRAAFGTVSPHPPTRSI